MGAKFLDFINYPDSPRCCFCDGENPSDDMYFRMQVIFEEGYKIKGITCCPVCLYEVFITPEELPHVKEIKNLGGY